MLKWVNYSVEKAKALSVNISVDVFHSTIGRYLTKAIRAVVLADLALKHLDFLEKNIAKGDLEIRNEVKFPVFLLEKSRDLDSIKHQEEPFLTGQ